MSEQDVLYSVEDGIATVTLNRPESLNALTNEMNLKLDSLVEEIKQDNKVKAVILTGNGRAFCAGTDIKAGSAANEGIPQAEDMINRAKQRKSTYDRRSRLFFNSIPKPVICAINGAAVGAGAELTLCCDVRIASESARWGEVFVLRGLVPDIGMGTYLLPRIVGLSKACELVFSGKIISAKEMLSISLVNEVVPNEQLIQHAKEMAKEFVKGAPLAVQACKQLMYLGLCRDIESHYQEESYYFDLCSQTEDAKEGIKSFFEKREPRWLGK